MMWILTLRGNEDDGAFAVENEHGDRTLLLFEEEDDATRYALMNEITNEHMPKLIPTEVEDDVAIKACEVYDYPYSIITSSDLVIPINYDTV